MAEGNQRPHVWRIWRTSAFEPSEIGIDYSSEEVAQRAAEGIMRDLPGTTYEVRKGPRATKRHLAALRRYEMQVKGL